MNKKIGSIKGSWFSVGQKIFHPFYGVGVVEKKDEKKEILGQTQTFSIFRFKSRHLQVMLGPRDQSLISELLSDEGLQKLFDVIRSDGNELLEQYPQKDHSRYNYCMDKIKSGDIYQMAGAVRDLIKIEKSEKKISNKEKKLLTDAMKVICETISDIRDVSIEEAEAMLLKMI